jgi:hypothetical protein
VRQPQKLVRSSRCKSGPSKGERPLGSRRAGQKNRLSFTQGLVADCTSDAVIVVDDSAFLSAPTRLGESYTVLIAFRSQEGLKLAGAEFPDPIVSSEIRTRWRLMQSESANVRLRPNV